ncbi:gluconate 2-dehydrogenase subunit 3 family protein [Bacillus sp. FJAT-44742]|uniref:gluconate 2-dehydrogenase subunit 3 family protein n=1 Tax=Bacillus sp. FJAT-44742 TaxID=2014005 RepID=UPI000C24FE39|nr:gluconate 2-dehydrogenase subunit 3 family protein [Bacillus sp. FJAT-44742]
MQDTAQETDTQTNDDQAHDHAPANDYTEARMLFKRQEDFHVMSAAAERIFPEDDRGPGAITLGVPYYIDKQLAGSYGRNPREYMPGPFAKGVVTQGFQSGIHRQNIFLQGISRMQSISRNNFNEAFWI